MTAASHSAPPPASNPAAATAPEDPIRAARHARQLAHLVEMQDMGMDLARQAHKNALDAPPPDPEHPRPAAADPTLAFSRATRAVRQAIQLENRIADDPGPRAPRAPRALRPFEPKRYHDPEHAPLRRALHQIADATIPDRPERTLLRHHIDERLEQELLDDPDRPAYQTFARIVRALDLRIDPAKLPDFLIGPPIPRSPFASASYEEERALVARARASPPNP